MRRNTKIILPLLGSLLPLALLFRYSDAYLPNRISAKPFSVKSPLFQSERRAIDVKFSSTRHRAPIAASRVFMTAEPTSEDDNGSQDSDGNLATLRDKLRKATGFSLTAFRAAWRAATGISLTAIYATAVAASGLWIRKTTSAILSIFPAWFRYFLQPFLVAYYFPMFIIRSWTGPSRKEAKQHHEALKSSWRDAVEFAEKTQTDGYWPVQVNENGDLELVSPPQPDESTVSMADAVAESVEQAMENGFQPEDPAA